MLPALSLLTGNCLLLFITSALVNVFKVRHGKETHVYRTESASDKKNMLAQFRHIAEELSAKRRKEREGEHERRKSLWVGGGGVRLSPTPWVLSDS